MRQATFVPMKNFLLVLLFLCYGCCHHFTDHFQSFALAASSSSSPSTKSTNNDDDESQQQQQQQQQQPPDDDFFFLCSGGKAKQIQKMLEKHPHWVHSTTKDDEHCLHLAGIQGFPAVTKLFLQRGADPNVRSNPDSGLRMTPLSWNVYINQYDNCKLLLEHGANVNLDFDHVTDHKTNKKIKITVLDLIELVSRGASEDEFQKLKQLLLQHGAKTYKQLLQLQQHKNKGD